METKFTPGPWAHFDSSAARDIFNGCSVIVSHHIDDAIIAMIGEDVPNHEGNARLIAAAPEMYAQLVKMRDGMNCVCKINKVVAQLGAGIECTACAINAILAKAVRP